MLYYFVFSNKKRSIIMKCLYYIIHQCLTECNSEKFIKGNKMFTELGTIQVFTFMVP